MPLWGWIREPIPQFSVVKRLFDIFLVLFFAPIWVPLAATVAVLVRLFLGSPVFFRDVRAGLGGRAFALVKFRTMREGLGDDAARLTRLGRFLRASSLDELPEFWNVLKGEMSLVGPRPLPVRYLPRYSAEQARRHAVRPGLTGWAQVHGRNALSWEEKFKFDVDYVDRHSPALDVYILVLTFFQCLCPCGISHAGEATMSEFTGGT